MDNISPQLQNQITQFQQVQQQLQNVSAQKTQMDIQLRELKRTLEELDKATGDVYKSAGALLIKVDDKDALKSELEESAETMEIRVKSFERQEKTLKDKYNSLRETINKAMGNVPAEE
ncbi:MAG: prefoldin subunit beta [Candidatus Methanomethylophilaceae archaeon]|jgi:prefoldin beta subunit